VREVSEGTEKRRDKVAMMSKWPTAKMKKAKEGEVKVLSRKLAQERSPNAVGRGFFGAFSSASSLVASPVKYLSLYLSNSKSSL